ncbi:MAG: metallophosphoesterase [Planctomycetes bacterium]|nr:metallophosphoesterase [Planctomycetota bacterium]
MATWVIGDIHGCAEELSTLIEKLHPGPDDRLVSVGDLFHRGPDPLGTIELLERHRVRFVLGNHEHVVLQRLGLAPERVDAADRPPRAPLPSALDEEALLGDGDQPCEVEPAARATVVDFLQRHSGFFLRRRSIEGAGPTRDGREWTCVHAGVLAGLELERHTIDELTSLRRLDEPSRPWWYELYDGPDLVLFGHTPSELPRRRMARGRLVALGLDTGCVYGGRLTAYSPELDEFASVQAVRAWART